MGLNDTSFSKSTFEPTVVDVIETINGNYLLLEWKNDKGVNYFIEVSINLQDKVSILFLGKKRL